MTEQQIQTKIIKYLKSIGAHVINTTVVHPIGTADLICCLNGLFYAFEVKKDAKSKVSPLQVYQIERVEKAGGKAFVVWSVDMVKNTLERLNSRI